MVAIILSAQCTDKRVNIITPKLFIHYPTITDLSMANIDDIKKIVKSCSFYNNKALNILNMAKIVTQEYSGKIPDTKDNLMRLPGVGQKTAHVFLIEFYNANLMAVDTHVFRVSHRLRLSNAKNVLQNEYDLTKIFKDNLSILHQAMVLFGRYICKAKSPECNKCYFINICQYHSNDK